MSFDDYDVVSGCCHGDLAIIINSPSTSIEYECTVCRKLVKRFIYKNPIAILKAKEGE